MSMSASTTITNRTGGAITFTSIQQINDDSTWNITPGVGVPISNGDSLEISMGNSSFFAEGVGFDAHFKSSNGEGEIKLDDPAVGSHHFDTSGNFIYDIQNPSGNTYVVTITTP